MGGSFRWLVVSAVLLGCGGGDEPPPSATSSGGGPGAGGQGAEGGGSSTTSTAGGAGGEGGATCAGHPQTAETIEMMAVAEDMPAPVGGPIVVGPYHLVAARLYVGPEGTAGGTGKMMKETQVWSLVDLHTVLDYGDGEGERRLELAYDLGDGTGGLATTVLCPEPLSTPWQAYSSDHGVLVLFAPTHKIAWEYALVR
jgi:hypothetical protein